MASAERAALIPPSRAQPPPPTDHASSHGPRPHPAPEATPPHGSPEATPPHPLQGFSQPSWLRQPPLPGATPPAHLPRPYRVEAFFSPSTKPQPCGSSPETRPRPWSQARLSTSSLRAPPPTTFTCATSRFCLRATHSLQVMPPLRPYYSLQSLLFLVSSSQKITPRKTRTVSHTSQSLCGSPQSLTHWHPTPVLSCSLPANTLPLPG